MSTYANKQRHENAAQPNHDPHANRQRVRQTAVSNAQTALLRQFPTLFTAPLARSAMTQVQDGSDDASQTA